MKTVIKIGNKEVGIGKSVFVIAEAGVNHNGELGLALRLVDAAARAGADAVKFQTFQAEEVVIANVPMTDYQQKNTGKKQSQLVMLRAFELRDNYYAKIIERCKKRGIIFLSTPGGGFSSVDWLQKLNVPAFKFGSGDLTNLPVLSYAAKFKKPMILGTGMATLVEVKDAVRIIQRVGNHNIIVLHATTSYPCLENDVNLRAMQTMAQKLDVLVGYSDHTLGTQVAVMAATLGACVIEKHFTLDRTLSGPDHKASLEPAELKMMVKAIRATRIILGSAQKKPTKNETMTLKNTRKSLVTLSSINKGEVFTVKNIGIKRPGIGVEPKYYFGALGRKANRNIFSDAVIKKKDCSKL